jgi:hypothetical protein
VTQDERDARTERFKRFAFRYNEAFAAAAKMQFQDLGPDTVVLRVRELSGADSFTHDGSTDFHLGYADRYRASKSAGYEDVVAMIDRCDQRMQFVAVAEYDDGSFAGRFS